MEDILKELKLVFHEKYDEKATKSHFSPGRVNLIGEHIDYNGGYVFPCAITQGTYGVARKREDKKIRCYSMNFPDFGPIEFTLDAISFDGADEWVEYVKGMVQLTLDSGYLLDSGFDLAIYGNIPNGAGLSSSASLELLVGVLLDEGMKNIILCIGGSATNDGGVGMAQALGYQFKDKDGNEIRRGGKYLKDIASIDTSNVHEHLASCEVLVASDVDNPLTGPEGAAAVFGPQKGATPEMVEDLDEDLKHLEKMIEKNLGKSVGHIPGAGAAGGLGAGLLAFTEAKLECGVEIIVEATRLKEKVKDADVVFTGEGQIDFQTKYGKTPMGVVNATKEVNKDIKVIAISGSIGEDVETLYDLGFDGIFGTIASPGELDKVLKNTLENVSRVTEAVCRTLK